MWREAAGLAAKSSVYRVARALRLDYASLKERASASGGRPRFVEMSGAQLMGPAPAAGALLEMAGGDGWRLTVRLSEGVRIDLEKLVRAFRGRRS